MLVEFIVYWFVNICNPFMLGTSEMHFMLKTKFFNFKYLFIVLIFVCITYFNVQLINLLDILLILYLKEVKEIKTYDTSTKHNMITSLTKCLLRSQIS